VRRERCLAEIDLMISRGVPRGANGIGALLVASPINFLTDNSLSVPAEGSRMCRTTFPLPCNIPSGSGNSAPCRKNKLTHLGKIAIEKIAWDAFSLGQKPIARAL
jgi:hypothetical protein